MTKPLSRPPATAAAIGADAVLRARYPYRVLDAFDLGVLSRFPIGSIERLPNPWTLIVDLSIGADTFTLVTTHPPARTFTTFEPWHIPTGCDATARGDREIERLHARIAARVASGEGVVAIGDFNTAPGE